MQRYRMQTAMQSAMVAVALVALNLAGAIAVSRTSPRVWIREPMMSFGAVWSLDSPLLALRYRMEPGAGAPWW